LVDGFGILGGDDCTDAVERHVATSTALDLIADDELAVTVVREAGELTVASVVAVAGLHAVGFDAIPGLCCRSRPQGAPFGPSDCPSVAPPMPRVCSISERIRRPRLTNQYPVQ